MRTDTEPCNECLKDQESHVRTQEEGWDLHCISALEVCGLIDFQMDVDDLLFNVDARL
jgi:hypothetical protein